MVTDLMQTAQAAAASAEQNRQSSHGRVNIRAVPKAAGNTSSGSNGKGNGERTYRHSHIGSSMQGERTKSWGCSDGMGLAGILGTACSLRGVAFSFPETQPRLRQDIVFR